jgi:PIN domain nuclease of toxin-antitoxin system
VTALLLDTHALIWWWSLDSRLGRQARRLISDPQAQVWVSAATIWEIVIKTALGRLQMAKRIDNTLLEELAQDNLKPLPITAAHALAVKQLATIHRDPFDRMLVAQAATEGLTLVTADPVLLRYGVNAVSASI